MYDSHLHLFVDDREIHQRINVHRVFNVPRRREAPVLIGDAPCERGHALAILTPMRGRQRSNGERHPLVEEARRSEGDDVWTGSDTPEAAEMDG